MLCYTMLCYTILCYAMLYYTIQASQAAARAKRRQQQIAQRKKVQLFTNKVRFFQLSNDLTTLRWSWSEYLLLDEV